ncbi:Amuc_1102 family pilus-like protein [Akkermansia sp.]|uniref:Amuc_1102 family pilus-like protein n=1 Tax=Akkermansia sp. TaxID=1872421 RepID=UPI003AB61F29
MKSILTFITAMLAAVLLIPAASAQSTSNPKTQVRVTLDKLSLYMRQSPNVPTQDDPRSLPKPKRWADFEVPFKVEASPMPKSGYIDSLTFKFYIAVVNPDRARQYLKLYKEIKYVNVPVGESTYASVYLSPSSVKRITGSEGGRGKWVKYEGVVVEYNGKVVAPYSSERGKMEKWWTIQSPSIVETTYYPLLNKDETPFSVYWYDRYPEIMKPNLHQGGSAPEPSGFGTPTPPETDDL